DHVIMEYVPGPSLHALLAGRAMPVAEAVRIAGELADGLAYAHQHGIVHRDLKLENVLIRTDGQPKIVDFGIACRTAIAGDSAVHEALTRDGFMVGTSRAMSPEQIQCREVDARSDLFSFGVLLYELVTGATPFAAAAEPLIMLRVLNDRQAPACDARPEVPPALSELIDHLLEKDPARRPETARTVRDRLRRMLDAPQPVPHVAPHVAPHLAPHLAPHGAADLEPLPPRRRLGSEPPPTGALRVERHQVALACIDLYAAGAGGDELAGREMIADALPAFRARIDEIVARSDGVLVSALGHRFIACFGHTRPVERAARRALLAGRAMLAAAAELRCPEPVPPGARFSATGAIHTGLAVVRTGGGAGDELLLGATLDTALRLLQIGGSGDLWLSEPAARAVEPEFQLERPAALPAGVPAARRLVDAPVAGAAGSGEHGLSIAQRDREPPPAPTAVRRAPDAADSAPRSPPLGELGIASQPIRRSLSSRIQAPFVLAQIRALRSSIFRHSPECRSALAIADKVETSYDLRRNDLFIPAGDTWCAILEPFAMTVLTGTLRRIGYEIFPQYVSILGIPTPDVRTAMELRSPIDLIRVICAAYSKCVIGTDAGTLTATVERSRAIVADTTIIPCHLQIGVFLGAGKLTGLFGDGALCEKRCRSRGDAACTYEFAL
ncbi:MAG TPA: protein kinase, partial [Kofleriaceae bacterium]|nr:protein kinase [Kofleriaceae bacterium]